MATLNSIQSKLATKVFDKLGSDTIVTNMTSSTTDKWGYKAKTWNAGTTVSAVPYNMIDVRNEDNPLGQLDEGDMDIIFKHDVTIDEDDKVTFNSKDWIVKAIEQFPYANGYVAQLVRVAELLD